MLSHELGVAPLAGRTLRQVPSDAIIFRRLHDSRMETFKIGFR